MSRRIDVSKFLFYAILFTCLLGFCFAFGLYSAANQTAVYHTVKAVKHSVEGAFALVLEEAPTLTKSRPSHFLQPARYKGSGVTVNDPANSEDEVILLSGFFDNNNELRLIRRDGSVIKRWPVRYSELFPDTGHMTNPPATDWNIDLHGALILPDGSVVFNFEYGGLVKLDRCGNVVWKLSERTHHSVEIAEDGGFWVASSKIYAENDPSPFPMFQPPFTEDTIIKVSEEGKILKEISVPKILFENGLEAVLTSNRFDEMLIPKIPGEIVHLNKVAELPKNIADSFPMFEAGDLLLSLCYLHMVLVVDPDTNEIKWWQVGPWLRQHDPEFKSDGTILVFNNNIYFEMGTQGAHIASDQQFSNIMEVDPVSGLTKIIYGDQTGQSMSSDIRGKQEITPNNGLLITEFQGGRVFETNAEGRIVWEYINRYDSDLVIETTEARIYPASYFRVSDWSCE